jgi:hypothetical protein
MLCRQGLGLMVENLAEAGILRVLYLSQDGLFDFVARWCRLAGYALYDVPAET